ncbi:MAG: mechanosensitive ion channel [Rhizobiales bacterium]|nr:mechanosensitive ion channel [Hyphomicrobiales bacterium]
MQYVTWIETQSAALLKWADAHLLSWGAAVQGLCIVLTIVAARFLSKHAAAWLSRKLQHIKPLGIIRIHASYQEIFFLIFMLGLLWCANLTAQAAALPDAILKTVAILATAWGIIRFTSSMIESRFWSRLIAVTLWIMAALSIFGWLTPAIDLADRAAFTVGTIRISLLLVIKSLIAYSVLFWLVRIFSSVLERSFRKATGLTPSQQVLFNKLANISLYTVAIIIGLNIVGLDLTSLAVFSGALGLGIGFGLQKVVSNLISGIILLMDKSIKPGDVIVVGDSYGWVNSLGARCVSVITRDGKEHLLPNENLITQTVENWSYSDRKVRLHIPIGVSYGSDVHLVKKLLLEAVQDHPRILKEPAPRCLIMGFGDSSIDHELRAWIYDPQEGVSNVKSDIFYRIWDLFKANNIEIPFPQRDVHIKASATHVPGGDE